MATIPELTALGAAPASGDLMVIHDVSAGTPQDKKITTADLFTNVVQQNGTATLSTATVTTLNATTFAVGSFSLTGALTFTSTSTSLDAIRQQTSTVSFSTVGVGAVGTDDIAFSGATVGDVVILTPTNAFLSDGVLLSAEVTGANNVRVSVYNNTGASYTASDSVTITLLQIS